MLHFWDWHHLSVRLYKTNYKTIRDYKRLQRYLRWIQISLAFGTYFGDSGQPAVISVIRRRLLIRCHHQSSEIPATHGLKNCLQTAANRWIDESMAAFTRQKMWWFKNCKHKQIKQRRMFGQSPDDDCINHRMRMMWLCPIMTAFEYGKSMEICCNPWIWPWHILAIPGTSRHLIRAFRHFSEALHPVNRNRGNRMTQWLFSVVIFPDPGHLKDQVGSKT